MHPPRRNAGECNMALRLCIETRRMRILPLGSGRARAAHTWCGACTRIVHCAAPEPDTRRFNQRWRGWYRPRAPTASRRRARVSHDVRRTGLASQFCGEERAGGLGRHRILRRAGRQWAGAYHADPRVRHGRPKAAHDAAIAGRRMPALSGTSFREADELRRGPGLHFDVGPR